MRKRMLALFLAIAMMLSMLPTAVFANEETTTEGEVPAAETQITVPEEEEQPEQVEPEQPEEPPVEEDVPEVEQPADEEVIPDQEETEEEPEEEDEELDELQISDEALNGLDKDDANGMCGDNLYWKLADGVLTIGGGSGAMADYSSEHPAPWICETVTKIVVEDGVTRIGNYAFVDRHDTTVVELSETVTSIGNCAFYRATAFTGITLPEFLTSIGEMAFAETGLESITIPANVSNIGMCAFGEAASLKSYAVDAENANFSSVDGVLFSKDGKELLAYPAAKQGAYKVPESTETIAECAFLSCTGLTEVELPEGLKTIGNRAFLNCTSLKSYTVNNPETVIGTQAIGYNTGSNGSLILVPGTVVNGHYGSTAHVYTANNKGITFKKIPGEIEVVRGKDETEDITELVSGKSYKLAAQNLDGTRPASTVSWGFTVEEKDFGTAPVKLAPTTDTYGCTVTAQKVTKKLHVTITATTKDGDIGSYKLTINPVPTALAINEVTAAEPVKVSGTTQNVDMKEKTTVQLAAVSEPADASNAVTWKSTNTAVAAVDTKGKVTFLKPGTATIMATSKDDTAIVARVTYVVIYVDKAATLTASTDAPAYGLQFESTAKITVKGSSDISGELVDVTIDSKYASIASVTQDSTGIWTITAGKTAGTVPVVCKLLGDPLNRTATVNVKVVPKQITLLTLLPPDPLAKPAEIKDGAVEVDATDMLSKAYTFIITPSGKYGDDTDAKIDSLKQITYSSSNTAVATVTAMADGTAKVTIKAKAVGECVIRATSTDAAKAKAELEVHVRDYAPVYAATKISMDSYNPNSVKLQVTEKYGNTITDVKLTAYNSKTKAYEPVTWLDANYASGSLEFDLVGADIKPNGSYKIRVELTTKNTKTYTKDITVTVKNVPPVISVKQVNKVNTFYSDSTAELIVSAKGAAVSNVELTDCTFSVSPIDDLTWEIAYNYIENVKDNSGTLTVWVDGYRYPVTRKITIATSVVKPALLITPTKSLINTNLSMACGNYGIWCYVYYKENGNPVPFTSIQVNKSTSAWAAVYTDKDTEAGWFRLELLPQLSKNGTYSYKGGTAVISVKEDNWTAPIDVKTSVTVSTKKPVLKLSDTKLYLNHNFPGWTVLTFPYLDQVNLGIASMKIEGADTKSKTALDNNRLTVAYTDITYDDGSTSKGIVVSLEEPENVPAGTYTALLKAKVLDNAGNEIELAPVKLPIVINAKKPVVKFKSSSLTVKPGKEATTTLYLDQKMIWIDSGVQFVGADTKGQMALKEGWFNLNCDASTGKITASLNSSASRPAPTGTYTFLVKTSIMGGELLPAKLTIRVTK